MVRSAVLVAFAGIIALFAASTPAPHPAGALFPPIPCDAKIGVSENLGLHPWLYTYITEMNYTPVSQNQDGTVTYNFETAVPDTIIPVTGTVAAEETEGGYHLMSGSGSGTYAGFATQVQLAGRIFYNDDNPQQPTRIMAYHEVGTDGSLPGAETIEYYFDCFFDPYDADPDGDGVTSKRHDTLGFASAAAGRLVSTNLEALTYRATSGDVTEVELAAPNDVITEDDKGGPFETHSKRKYYEVMGNFGGSISPALSQFQIGLPPELGGATVTSPFSGNIWGRFEIESDGSAVRDFVFGFHAHGEPFAFNGVTSGDWSWQIDTTRNITITAINLQSGQASLTVPTLLVAQNLRAIYSDTDLQATGEDGLPGEPLRFLENVNISFPPLAQITSVMDNCPEITNADQADGDGDGIGNACDGHYWADGNCNTRLSVRDALATLLAQAGVEDEDRPVACHAFGSQVGGLTIGDWNCDGQQTAEDALIPLLAEGELALGDLPAECPDPGEFVPEVLA
jgi:hypothetical protein